jgi:hypothetical protein
VVELMAQTTEMMLSEVETAITTVLIAGQSYKIGSRSLTRADLNLLIKMRNDLRTQLTQEGSNGLLDNTYLAVFEGR